MKVKIQRCNSFIVQLLLVWYIPILTSIDYYNISLSTITPMLQHTGMEANAESEYILRVWQAHSCRFIEETLYLNTLLSIITTNLLTPNSNAVYMIVLKMADPSWHINPILHYMVLTETSSGSPKWYLNPRELDCLLLQKVWEASLIDASWQNLLYNP